MTQGPVGNGHYGLIYQVGVVDAQSDVVLARHPGLVPQYPPYVVTP